MKKIICVMISLFFVSGCYSLSINDRWEQEKAQRDEYDARQKEEFQKKLEQADTWDEFRELENRVSGRMFGYIAEQGTNVDNKRRKWYLDTHDVPPKRAEFIKQGDYTIGMTKNELSASIGFPNKINRTTSRYTNREQWVYEESGLYSYDIKCFYFDDGILTTIQD